jgi:molybdopterin-guanine dinucleotide biosynthesis protein A
VNAPLYGLVLAGGESRRMGRDKAALQFHGRSQVDWAYALLERHCARVFVSVRPSQLDDPTRAAHPAIVDRHAEAGPIAGIAAAQEEFPAAAWLVVACDLPFLADATIENLIAHRGSQPIVAYRSTHDGLPEPLCAIYEPVTQAGIAAAIAGGKTCPRKFIIQSGVPLLAQPDPAALDNVNTPDDLARAQERLRAHS